MRIDYVFGWKRKSQGIAMHYINNPDHVLEKWGIEYKMYCSSFSPSHPQIYNYCVEEECELESPGRLLYL